MKLKKKSSQTARQNPFAGADDVYLTKNKIAVTKTTNTKSKRGFSKVTKTKYYAQNESNVRALKAAKGDTVRVGRKSINYKNL